MAGLSRRQRKLIGEAVRQTVANLGVIHHAKHDDGNDNSKPDHQPPQSPQKNSFDVICEILTVGISAVLFAIVAACFIGFFGQFAKILYFGAAGISLLIVFGAIRMVCNHGCYLSGHCCCCFDRFVCNLQVYIFVC